MELKPRYKLTEVGVIPAIWDVVQLGDMVDYTKGYAFKSSEYQGDGIRVIRVSDTTYDTIVESSSVFVGYNKASQYAKWSLKEHDLVISTVGSKPPMYDSMVGKVILIKKVDEGSLLNQNAVLIRDKKRRPHIQRLLLDHLRTKRYLTLIETIFRGNANQASITLDELFQFAIPLPNSEAEQRAIAAALSDVDTLIAALDQLIAKKRDLKQAVMQQLLTGQTRLPGFHSEWVMKPFASVLIRLNAKAHQIQASDYQAIGKYPVVDQGKEIVIGFSDREDKRLHCPDGGVIVFGDHTCFVKFIDFDFLVGADGTQVLQGKDGQSTRFHAFQLQYQGVEPTGYNRHFKFLKERDFLVPSLPEQPAIAAVLSDMDAEITALEQRRDKTRTLKQGMMQELLTGRTRLV